MRSPTARDLAQRVSSPQWLSRQAATLVGESHR
jgi:hypothetical protein